MDHLAAGRVHEGVAVPAARFACILGVAGAITYTRAEVGLFALAVAVAVATAGSLVGHVAARVFDDRRARVASLVYVVAATASLHGDAQSLRVELYASSVVALAATPLVAWRRRSVVWFGTGVLTAISGVSAAWLPSATPFADRVDSTLGSLAIIGVGSSPLLVWARPRAPLALAWIAGSLLAVMPDGRFFGHYVVAAAPVLALAIPRPTRGTVLHRVATVVLATLVVATGVGLVWCFGSIATFTR